MNLIIDEERSLVLKEESHNIKSLNLSPRQVCDVELLMNGGFSPLTGFMTQEDYESVCSNMRLTSGTLWSIPITLDVPERLAQSLENGERVALRDPEGVMLAVLNLEDKWKPDKKKEANDVFGTLSEQHPGVAYLLRRAHDWYIGGRLDGVQIPKHFDFLAYRRTPAELRSDFARLGWRKIIAFQTRNPMHRAHYELTMKAVRDIEANLLIHPVVGMTKPGDVDHYTRVRCYQALLPYYPMHTVMLSLLPLAMRMGGPREALWHAIIRRNYGCTHLIVGRDYAGPGQDTSGNFFYDPYDAQKLLQEHTEEIGVEMVPFHLMVYVEDRDIYEPIDSLEEGTRTANISGTELREKLARGSEIPTWFTFPEVAEQLRRTHPPRTRQGFTVFFTGLSGAGKSTLAKVLQVKLLEMGGRPVTLLDGDIVRKNLSSELGFSKDHRDINIRRIGFVASEITKNGGIALCAPIAPYDLVRREVRALIEPLGGFILVYVATPIEVCESRDRKGLYAKARAGIISDFTGVSDPYEAPQDAELSVDTSDLSPDQACQEILLFLEHEGFIG